VITAEQEGLLDTINDMSERLNSWENDFIESISEQDYDLTESQESTLNRIFDKVCK